MIKNTNLKYFENGLFLFSFYKKMMREALGIVNSSFDHIKNDE